MQWVIIVSNRQQECFKDKILGSHGQLLLKIWPNIDLARLFYANLKKKYNLQGKILLNIYGTVT